MICKINDVNCGNPREPPLMTPGDPWWLLFTNDVNENKWKKWKKTGEKWWKTGVNPFFQKNETESWGLSLMNGGLKTALFVKIGLIEAMKEYIEKWWQMKTMRAIYLHIKVKHIQSNTQHVQSMELMIFFPIL